MSVPANAERAASADAALLAYITRTHSDCEECLLDLLADLMHWADKCGQLRHWLDTVANPRVHATTQRVVNEVFAEEKPTLKHRRGRLLENIFQK